MATNRRVDFLGHTHWAMVMFCWTSTQVGAGCDRICWRAMRPDRAGAEIFTISRIVPLPMATKGS